MYNPNRNSTLWIAVVFGISLTLNFIHNHEQFSRHYSHYDCNFDHTLVPDTNYCPICAVPVTGVQTAAAYVPPTFTVIQVISEEVTLHSSQQTINVFSERAPPLG
jgi:hypothetical protein